MKRTLEPEAFNHIANDPSVRPGLGGGNDELDLTAIVQNPANFCFLTDCRQGGYICQRLDQGLYEAHTLALPSARGRPMLRTMRAAFAAMFLGADAVEIVTTVIDGNRGADTWAIHAGFRETFRRENVSFRTLGYADWVLMDPDNAEAGRTFHEEIHRFTPDDHGEDSVHDAWVGATLRGIRDGNAAKWIAGYNRWAAHAKYVPVTAVSFHPLVLDFASAVVQFTPPGFEVLKVRTARSAPSQSVEGDASCLSAPPSLVPPLRSAAER